jgi:DNA-directed RNA polymerase beta subunit
MPIIYGNSEMSDLSNIDNDDITSKDLLTLVMAVINRDGLNSHNTESYSKLLDEGIERIMVDHFNIDRKVINVRKTTAEDKSIENFRLEFKFHTVEVGKPIQSLFTTGSHADMYPSTARITGKSYCAAITSGVTVSVHAKFRTGHTETKVAEIPPFKIGEIPVMVRSTHCHLDKMTRESIKSLREDNTDNGGYFITGGNEYIVDMVENIRYNSPHIHFAIRQNERVRLEFLSQPGGAFENSSQSKFRFMQNGQITIELTSTKFERVVIPFFILYRLFGMMDDKVIMETIVNNIDDGSTLTVMMLETLEQAIHNVDPAFEEYVSEISREKLIKMTSGVFIHHQTGITNNTDENVTRYFTEELLGSPFSAGSLDKIYLPHMGQNYDDREKKLRFTGKLIRKLLLAWFKVLPPTDRDSYKNKRVHSAGVTMAKAYKTHMNGCFISPSVGAIRKMLLADQWSSINAQAIHNVFRNSVNTADLSRAMDQVLTTSSDVIVVKQKTSTNRVVSQQLERKNTLNVLCSMRNITTQNANNRAKQTERALLMRMVTDTFDHFICYVHSNDSGEAVGMKKQLAINASICDAGDTTLLKHKLLSDPLVIPLIEIPIHNPTANEYSDIYVNGYWLGATKNTFELLTKYRQMRRNGEIDRYTTIYHEIITNDIEFCLDVGRLKCPSLIVYNNIDEFDNSCREHFQWEKNGKTGPEPKKVEFTQNVLLTKQHIHDLQCNKITLNDLVVAKVVEYLTVEECENCLFAENLATLRKHRNNYTYQYTHCGIEQTVLGLAAHVSPYATHTQPTRITYETNQGRSTGGWYALNFPYRIDKIRFLQFYNQIPLVKTITNNIMTPNGSNIVVAYIVYGGDNQEDSAIVNRSSADRGLFDGVFFKYIDAYTEKNDIFVRPDPTTTKNIKPNANYNLLNANGLVKKWITIRSGDVIIGRVTKINKAKNDMTDGFTYSDKSVIYRGIEPAFIEDVLNPRGADDAPFVIVKLRFERPLRIGDKVSSRSGNKGIVSLMLPQCDMPFTEDGIVPDILVNPHSFPSRMIIGQMIETFNGILNSRVGKYTDGTAFLPINPEGVAIELNANGYRYNGLKRMYNGFTGEYFDAAIFVGTILQQRLQKFVLDDEQAVAGSGPTDATTGQPLGGKHLQGGLRIGEMEFWCMEAHGCTFNMYEKKSIDSDGRIVHICRNCGEVGIYNEYKNIYECKRCEEYADISAVESSKTASLLREELAGANIKLQTNLKPREYTT